MGIDTLRSISLKAFHVLEYSPGAQYPYYTLQECFPGTPSYLPEDRARAFRALRVTSVNLILDSTSIISEKSILSPMGKLQGENRNLRLC